MNGISLICLNFVRSHRDDEMEGRMEAQVFKGDVSPWSTVWQAETATAGNSHFKHSLFFWRGEQTARPLGKGKKPSWDREEKYSLLQIEKPLMSFKVSLWAGNHHWRLWAKGELFVATFISSCIWLLQKLRMLVYVQIKLDFLKIKSLWSFGQLTVKKWAKQIHLPAQANLMSCQQNYARHQAIQTPNNWFFPVEYM